MVVKVGTATITEDSGRIDRDRVANLVRGISFARKSGIDAALVSSGAIGAGMEKLGLEERPSDIETLQAVASVGQGLLVGMYSELFGEEEVTAGQVLLTRYDMMHRQQYLNARHTLEKLFAMGVVPVINENDTVSTEEISFGDNDMLAAMVAGLVGADLLVILTDTAGLFTEDPRKSQGARLIDSVERITEEIESLGGEAGSQLALGGMSSKLQAAKVAVNTGVSVVIANGRAPRALEDILSGSATGTRFQAGAQVRSKKKWIGYAKESCGLLKVDEGAARALLRGGKSLLAAGVAGVEGSFEVGDCVDIIDEHGKTIGRGVTNYSADEAKRIKGLTTGQIEQVLGEKGEEMIHRDELFIYEDACGEGEV